MAMRHAGQSIKAGSHVEREVVELLRKLPERARRRMVGCDKGFGEKAFVRGCRDMNTRPRAAAKRPGGPADGVA